MKARNDLATMIGWNAEAFARTKQMKPLPEYLKPALSPEQQRAEGAQGLRSMIQRMKKKQEGG